MAECEESGEFPFAVPHATSLKLPVVELSYMTVPEAKYLIET